MLTGLFFSDFYAKQFKEEIRLLAELKDDVNKSEVKSLEKKFTDIAGIKEGSVHFISRAEALEEMYGELGDDMVMDDIDNPFSDMIEFSVVSDSFNEGFVEQLAIKIEKDLPVTQVHYPSDYFENVFGVLKTAKSYLLIFVIIALSMTGILIHHIMRLNVIAQQRQIRTMELVGARPNFIRRPFLKKGLQMGVHAWLIAVVLSGIIWYVILGVNMFSVWAFSIPGLVGVTVLFCLSVLVCLFSTWIAVTKSLGTSILQG